jgi:predicted negative regulator of RcsB-dependent stress response
MVEHGAGHEAEEVQEVMWTYTGWAVILLVCVGAGVFIGWSLWGNASSLQRDLSASTETVNTLKNERETLKSQLALITRDKQECDKRLSAAMAARAGAAAGGAPGGAGAAPGAPAGAAPGAPAGAAGGTP